MMMMMKLVNLEYVFVIVVVLTWCWQIEGFGKAKDPFEKSQTENLNSIGDQCFCKVISIKSVVAFFC